MKIVYIILIIFGVGIGGYYTYKSITKANAQSTSKDQTAKVTRGDLDVAITGTGTVQPIARYDIVPLVKGNILKAPFEEGMDVKQGDLLYAIDNSDLSYNIEKAQNGIQRLQINNGETLDSVNNLTAFASIDGRISNLSLKEGDQVGSNGKIGDITNDKRIIANIPFIKSDIDKIKVGDAAELQAVDEWASVEGRVKSIS